MRRKLLIPSSACSSIFPLHRLPLPQTLSEKTVTCNASHYRLSDGTKVLCDLQASSNHPVRQSTRHHIATAMRTLDKDTFLVPTKPERESEGRGAGQTEETAKQQTLSSKVYLKLTSSPSLPVTSRMLSVINAVTFRFLVQPRPFNARTADVVTRVLDVSPRFTSQNW